MKLTLSISEAQAIVGNFYNTIPANVTIESGYISQVPPADSVAGTDKRIEYIYDILGELKNVRERRSPNAIAGIKAVRALTGLGLGDAKREWENLAYSASVNRI